MSPAAYGPSDDDDLRAMLGADHADLDEAQVAELRRQLEEVTVQHRHPAPPPLGPGELRALLRECVNVVEPGDVLVLRVDPGTFNAMQLRELQDAVNDYLIDLPGGQVRALVVPAEEIKILHPAPPMVTFRSPPGEIDQETAEAARYRLEQVRMEHSRPPQRIPPDPDTP